MKGTSSNPNAILGADIPSLVIPVEAGIQPNKASGFRVDPGMTTLGFAVLRANQLAEARMMHRVRMTISPEVPGVKLA